MAAWGKKAAKYNITELRLPGIKTEYFCGFTLPRSESEENVPVVNSP